MAAKGKEPRVVTLDEIRSRANPRRHNIFGLSGDLIWQSQEGPQTETIWLAQGLDPDDGKPLEEPVDELLVGGARFGGKTELGIAWISLSIGVLGYRGLVLRFTAEALKEWIDRAWQYFKPMGAKLRGRPPEFHFPPLDDPRHPIIYMGHLRDDRSFEDYKGHQYDKILIEEGTQIRKLELYLKLLSSNRPNVDNLRSQVMITTNPDGPGHDWIKRRFVKVYSGGKQIPPKTPFKDAVEKKVRIFIPMGITNNPIGMERSPGYYHYLDGLPEHLRQAWLFGNWDAVQAQYFPDFRPNGPHPEDPPEHRQFANHVVPAHTLPPWCHRWIACDWGFRHHSAVLWGCNAPDKRLHVYRELLIKERGSDELGAEIARASIEDLEGLPDRQMTLYLSHDAFSARDRDKTIAEQIQSGIEIILGPGSAFVLALNEEERAERSKNPEEASRLFEQRRFETEGRAAIAIRRCNPDRVAGWNYMRTMLRWKRLVQRRDPDPRFIEWLRDQPDGYLKLHNYMSQFESQQDEVVPRLLIHDSCPVLIDLIPSAMSDPNKPEDVMKFDADDNSFGDDILDVARYLQMAHRDYESKVPYPEWMQGEIQKYAPSPGPDGKTDINRLIQIGMRAAERYKKQNSDGMGIDLPRESVALRIN